VIRVPVLVAALAPLWALGAEWSATFPPDRLATHLPEGEKLSVLVAAAGPESAEAAQALQAAFRATGRAELVMDEAPLGGVAGLEDPAIVKRAAGQPVDAVVVVRVFHSGAEPPTVVVAAYDRSGGATFGFSARAGAPMEAASAAQRTAGQRASQQVAELARAASDAYDQKMVGIDEFYSQGLFGKTLGYTQPYQGKYKHEIGWEAFYEITGHKDLAARLAGGKTLKFTLSLAGFVGVPAGLLLLLLYPPLIGAAVIGGAAVCWLFSAILDPQPADLEQRKKIAEDYNASLRGGHSAGVLHGAL